MILRTKKYRLSIPEFGSQAMATRQAFGISLDEFAQKISKPNWRIS